MHDFWSKDAFDFSREIGKRITALTGEERATVFIRQRIAVELARGTAVMMLEGLNPNDALYELFEM